MGEQREKEVPASGAGWLTEDALWRELWIYAVFLHGEEKAAAEVLRKAVSVMPGRPEAGEEIRARRYLFSRIRRSAPRTVEKSVGRPELPQNSPLTALRSLPPSLRVLAGLHYGTTLPAAEISRVLGLSPAETTRLQRQMEDALATVGDSSDRDLVLRQALQELSPDESTLARLTQEGANLAAKGRGVGLSPRDPAFLAVVFAAVLLVALAVWMFLGQGDTFPGEDEVLRLLQKGTSATADEYEPVAVPLREMGDWFALQGLEGFWTPSGFGEQQTLAARVFTFEGTKVASVLLPEHQMIVYLFDGATMGIEVQPPGHWRFLSSGEDVGAVVQKGRVCFLVARRGSAEELRDALEMIIPRG
jgi:hypothetical protein